MEVPKYLQFENGKCAKMYINFYLKYLKHQKLFISTKIPMNIQNRDGSIKIPLTKKNIQTDLYIHGKFIL